MKAMVRPSLYLLPVLLACFATSVETAQAAGFQCSKQQPARVRVIVTTNPVKYDNSKTENELQHFKIDTVNPYGTHVETDVGGLMSGGLQIKSNIQIAWETDRRTACFYYKTVDVTLHIDPTVYIARDHRPGTCMYNAILQHENKHVETDRSVARAWRGRIQNYLQAQVDRAGIIGPLPIAQQAATRQAMTDLIRKAMEKASKPMDDDRRARQQAIDTRAEYDRVSGLCR